MNLIGPAISNKEEAIAELTGIQMMNPEIQKTKELYYWTKPNGKIPRQNQWTGTDRSTPVQRWSFGISLSISIIFETERNSRFILFPYKIEIGDRETGQHIERSHRRLHDIPIVSVINNWDYKSNKLWQLNVLYLWFSLLIKNIILEEL